MPRKKKPEVPELTVVKLDPVRDALARGFLFLLGLRHVYFVSFEKDPIAQIKAYNSKIE
jgi:hypothetical protein